LNYPEKLETTPQVTHLNFEHDQLFRILGRYVLWSSGG